VARRNLVPMLVQNLLQPLLFTFIFGRVMTTSGMMPMAYKSMLLPGVMAISTLAEPAVRVSRIITPALAHACVFCWLTTRAAICPSPLKL
jgi:hypothetical protein